MEAIVKRLKRALIGSIAFNLMSAAALLILSLQFFALEARIDRVQRDLDQRQAVRCAALDR